MWKKCNVVMLPTKQKSPMFIGDEDNYLISTKWNEDTKNWFFRYLYQHLYILSDDKIEKNNWCIGNDKLFSKSTDQYFLAQCTSIENGWIYLKVHEGEGNNPDYTKKIIATTDASLAKLISDPIIGKAPIQFPQISQSFIDHYIQQYNKGNIITEVMVEYVDNWYIHIPSGKYHDDEPVKMKGNLGEGDYYLKVNPDNTINIKSLKDSWTREEVIKVIYEVLQATGKTIRAEMRNIQTTPYITFSKEDLNKWIKDNI